MADNIVCVDYLAHEWSCKDLIQVYQELKKQKSKTLFNLIACENTPKKQKKLRTEQQRQIRYQNAIWRHMAKTCTNKLSASNALVHPSSVNWQKEADITWLYGPLYVSPDHSDFLTTTHISTMPNLRPALKKTASTSKHAVLLELTSHYHPRYWSKTVSESGKQHSVRFHPDITEVSFLPETPTQEISAFLAMQHEEHEDEVEPFWPIMKQVGSYLGSNLLQNYQQQYTNITQFCMSMTTFLYTTLFMLVVGRQKKKKK
ncbi:hypothetical protein CU098_011293 [Rhizopus stolonifer]|uniref:Uncharacterized protein n=1 Tax=Rhizopus stolonifer TaxID=4846 RepID=A0A367KLN9_RHIST|nr:hypothetical protein CU098_011293 [Rhizopus stolonifer]